MSNITPATETQIEQFYKAASAHLTSLGVAPEYHGQLLNNELSAQYGKLTKSALGTIGEAAPELNQLGSKELITATTKDYTSKYAPHIPAAGGGKAGLLKKVLLGLGIGGSAAGIGAGIGALASKKDDKAKPAPKKEAPKKEAMDKTIEGGIAKGTIKDTTSPSIKSKLQGKKVTYGEPKGLPPGAKVTSSKITEVKESAASKVAEDIAVTALYKAAKEHMVTNLQIPEPQAKEILNKHFGIK